MRHAHARRGNRTAVIGVAALTLAAFALLVGPALSTTKKVHIANFSYTPMKVTIHVNDTVRWRWDGPDTNHSVTSKSGQKEKFDSDPGKSASAIDHAVGFLFSHKFKKTGTFTYFCKVHGFTGKVTVIKPKKKKKKKTSSGSGSTTTTTTTTTTTQTPPPTYTPPPGY